MICGYTQRRIIHPERGRHSLQWFQSAVYCRSTSEQLSHQSEGPHNLQPSAKTPAPICELSTQCIAATVFHRSTKENLVSDHWPPHSPVNFDRCICSVCGKHTGLQVYTTCYCARQYLLVRRGAGQRARRWCAANSCQISLAALFG